MNMVSWLTLPKMEQRQWRELRIRSPVIMIGADGCADADNGWIRATRQIRALDDPALSGINHPCYDC